MCLTFNFKKMKKLLVLAFLGLLFAVTQAANRDYFPDVGYDLIITQDQPDVTMPVMVVDQQYVCFTQLSSTGVIDKSSMNIYFITNRKTKDVPITAYHNPDYGRNSKYNFNALITIGTPKCTNRLITTRHVI